MRIISCWTGIAFLLAAVSLYRCILKSTYQKKKKNYRSQIASSFGEYSFAVDMNLPFRSISIEGIRDNGSEN